MSLEGFQRKYLRALAHLRRPIVHVGEAGVSDSVIDAVETALAQHELVKIRLHEPEDKRESARELASRSGAELCGLVGHTVILYRRHPEKPEIELPAR